MNILIVISDLGLGGAQKVAISLANGLAEKHTTYLYDLSPEVRKSDFFAEISYKVCVVEHKSTLFEKIIFKILYAILSRLSEPNKYEKKLTYLEKQWFIKRFAIENKIDIVNTHMWWADQFIVDAFNGSPPCPIVISSHGDHIFHSVNNRILGYTEQLKRVFSKATALLYLSDNYIPLVAQLKMEHSPRMIKVINGFALKKPIDDIKTKVQKTGFTFIIASRAREDKGWKEAIECVLHLHKNGYSDCTLLLAGDGEFLEELKKQYPQREYPFLIFWGFVGDVISYINISDIILLPSYEEQMPTFIIEGLFLGKPVIATDVGEIKTMISYNNDLAGIILTLKHGKPVVEELYDAMLELMLNFERRNKCSEIALKAYEKFDYSTFINHYENIFLSVLNKE